MKLNLEDLRSALDHHGLMGGLEFLNHRVDHRFTAVYRFHDSAMNVQAMFDKLQERVPDPFAVVPITNSFCEMAMDQGCFIASDSVNDPRLDGNPYQSILGSYVGLPLEIAPGELYGTLCHYDLVGRPITDEEFEFLQRAARLFPAYLKKPRQAA
jgi:GAF domain-containing protein